MKPVNWRKWLEGDVYAPREWPMWKKIKWARFRNRLARVAMRMRMKLEITEGPRTYEDQRRLYEKYHGVRPVAFPGTSNHEIPTRWHSPAADVRTARTLKSIGDTTAGRKAMEKYGMHTPVKGEPWHVELKKR